MEPRRGALRLVSGSRSYLFFFIMSIVVVIVEPGCGESRRPIGEECLRDSDCLSDVCAARVCVSAPSLVRGGATPPGDEEPRIPDAASGLDGG